MKKSSKSSLKKKKKCLFIYLSSIKTELALNFQRKKKKKRKKNLHLAEKRAGAGRVTLVHKSEGSEVYPPWPRRMLNFWLD